MARVRELHQPRGRRDQGLILLEGTHLVQECRRWGLQPELLVATPDWFADHPALAGAWPQQAVTAELLSAMASTETPDGVLALVASGALPSAPPLPQPASSGLWLALDRLQDPGNLGTLLRTSLASGVGGLWLGGGADPWQPKVLRASAGASLQLPLRRQEELGSIVQAAGAAGWQVLAAVREGGQPYWEVDWRPPSLLLLGNEGAGLAPELLALPEVRRVSIPHDGRVESLNVAVAGGVLLLERWRQVTADRGESSAAGLGR
ncbi:MAG: RNA methyltransferase [Cyanobacteriota bacterium]|nr:RNA methyltransferase [Cyanobacteriota bacterium]